MESQIRAQLDQELSATNPPPLGDLVAGAVTAGRRRRRFFTFGGSAAGLAVVAVIGAAVALHGGGPARDPGAVAPPQVPAASPTKHVTGQAVVAMLESKVPTGGTFTEVDFSIDGASAFGGFVDDDGHGAATVSGQVSDAPADYGTTGMACPADAAGFHCELRTLPNGDEARVLTMGPYGGDCNEAKCSLKDVRVELHRADGAYITAEASSGPFGHGRGATRPDTILDADALLAITQDPRWGLTMDAAFVDDAETNIHAG